MNEISERREVERAKARQRSIERSVMRRKSRRVNHGNEMPSRAQLKFMHERHAGARDLSGGKNKFTERRVCKTLQRSVPKIISHDVIEKIKNKKLIKL